MLLFGCAGVLAYLSGMAPASAAATVPLSMAIAFLLIAKMLLAPGARQEAPVRLSTLEVVEVHPADPRELAEKLDLRRGAPDGYERRVVISAESAIGVGGALEVHGPLDGSVLHVVHEGGVAPLRVRSGRVEVNAARRPWATSVRVEGGAQVRVVAAERSKIATHTRPGAETTLAPVGPGLFRVSLWVPGRQDAVDTAFAVIAA